MEFTPVQQPEATTSDTASQSTATRLQVDQDSSSSSTQHLQHKQLRSSARVKAAKQKSKENLRGKGKERDLAHSSSEAPLSDSATQRTTRSGAKAKRIDEDLKDNTNNTEELAVSGSKRTRRTTNTSSLKITEPVKDPKGKKRAAPETVSDVEDSPESSSKRARKGYSLRTQTQSSKSSMPRKSRNTASKEKSSPLKAKMAGSSRLQDQDVEMLDASYHLSESDVEEHLSDNELPDMPKALENSKDDEGCSQDEDDDDEGERQQDTGMASSDGPPIPPSIDEATALGIFGDFRQFGSYMMSLSSRLKTMLNNIKSTADPTTRLLTLQELSELLSISTEDTLAGSFQVEAFVRELVRILGGRGAEEDEDDEGEDDMVAQDEDSALAAALAMSTGGMYQGDENPEAQVLACRCLANLMEALPGVAHTIVYHGAIPVLCSKLIEISYIDLAEQTLSTLEKISEEFPSSIVREGGLAALLNYLDFFSIAVQRVALQAASNCCRNILPEYSTMIHGAWPIIRNCLSYADQRLVEFACLCVIRVVDSYYRNSVENLEALVNTELIHAVIQLLLPAGGSPLIAPSTYTSLLRAMAVSAKASPKITVALLEANIVDTLYQILTGVLPSAVDNHQEQGSAAGGQGLGGGLADMTVMENLAHRPKEQIEEALTLISELLPPLPRDGVFDHRGYTEKSLVRMVKAKAKADRAAARQAVAPQALAIPASAAPPSEAPSPEPMADSQQPDAAYDTPAPTPSAPKEVTLDRTEVLRSKTEVVGRFMQLMVPILIDVYAASVITPVRTKTLNGLMKAVSFLDAEGLKEVLSYVPIASFASSILSSRDHPNLVIGALQLVDLLLTKVPHLYKPAFRKEGVFHEIELLAQRQVTPTKPKDKEVQDAQVLEAGNVPVPSHPSPGYKKGSSVLEPEDAITLRARVLQFKFLSSDTEEDQGNTFELLRRLVEQMSSSEEAVITDALKQLAELFASPYTSVSSFELLQSGVIDSLLQLATDTDHAIDIGTRKTLLMDAFVARDSKGLAASQTPFATLVKKLQESLTRMESFEVTTIAHGIDDSKRSSPSLLARQLRLRLVADEDSDIPRNLHNIVVSIHAIATFQALHDYLRPRVAGLLQGGSRLQGMLAALAASGFTGTPRIAGSSETPSSSSASRGQAAMSENSAGAGSNSTITRRRSQRLKAKNGVDGETSEPGPSTSQSETPTNQPLQPPLDNLPTTETAPSDTVVDSELAAEFTDEEDLDAEVFDEDEVDPDQSITEKTVTLSVAEDGSKVEAQTPDGTRVATPNSAAKEAGTSISSAPRAALSAKASYAAALKAKPTDWHLEFSMEDHVLPLDLTIYGAIHQHEGRKKTSSSPSMFWQGVYTVKFKKVAGPASDSRDGTEGGTKNRSPSPSLSSLPEASPHSKILRLLKVLHQLNMIESERPSFSKDKRSLAETAFINNKLTAKLTRQLEEPMIVASSCLPDWALDLPQHFPFVFPFATRYNFLQSTSFGYARLILRWQSQQSQSRSQDTSRRDDGIGFLGRLQRQKVRISRKHLLESAVKVFELYGSSSSILEVEYFEEVGTGLGPTLEFYSLVSKEFARRDLKIWRDTDSTHPGPYVGHPSGLYPAPLESDENTTDGSQKRTHLLRVVGQFVAKAMLDSRIIDLHFNKIFMKLVLGEDVPLTIDMLRLVDSELANSLTKIQSLAAPKELVSKPSSKTVDPNFKVEDMGLDFTIPGYDIELRAGGKDIAVTSENVDEYINEVLDAILGKGVQAQVQAFKEGFSKVFPINDLQAFSAEELAMLFGNSDEDWSRETLSESLKADHGFNTESRAIRDLVDIISNYDVQMRRAFLQFITGSPKLPIGGFRGLNPLLTVVRKPHEAPLTADDYLPSVMTCVNYLKLPEYSSKDVMREKLRTAIQEGVGSFHLS